MKTCNHCGKEKPDEEFAGRWKDREVRQGACKECRRPQQNRWYRQNKESHLANTQERKAQRKNEAQEYIWDYLSSHPCVDCGESDPAVLEFDHVRGRKRNTISGMIHDGLMLSTIQREISKCEVRCANCHRRKTHKEKGWFRG